MDSKSDFQRKLYQALDLFFGFMNTLLRALLKYPLLIVGLVILLVVAILVLLVNKDVNVGGVLQSFLEKFSIKNNSKVVEANSIPKDREQAIGEADKRGFVQHKVDALPNSSNPFRDKSKVKLPSGKTVKLPEGIKDSDVDLIIETKLDVVVVPKKEVYEKLETTKQTIEEATTTNEKAKKLLESLKRKKND